MTSKAYQTATIINSDAISVIYMQEMHLYSSMQTVLCISGIISGGYFPVPILKPNPN
jgi:hypothetical protein